MKKRRRVYQNTMWLAAQFYCREADKCYKAKAYFCAIVARGCELEALLRIFDFVENRRPRDRCRNFNGLINRAFTRHWIPHDALRDWKKSQGMPLKVYPHDIREIRNGVHAHLFDKRDITRQAAVNIAAVVHAMYDFLEIKNARNLMKALHKRGDVSDVEYNTWKKKQAHV